MGRDIKQYIKNEGQDAYNNMLYAIQNSSNEGKAECYKYANTIVENNVYERNTKMCKVGFALSFFLSCASIAGVCLSQNYTQDGSRIGMSILSVLLLTTFITTSIFSFIGIMNPKSATCLKDEARVNGVSAELEYNANNL